jgi:hypothetical protein
MGQKEKTQFGFLGGLLPPKPSEAFRKTATPKKKTSVKPKMVTKKA